ISLIVPSSYNAVMLAWLLFTLFGIGLSQTSMPAGDDHVVLFPVLGHMESEGRWVVPLHGWIYEDGWSDPQFRFWLHVLDFDDELSPAEQARLQRRLGAFLVDNERGMRVELEVGGQRVRSGHSAANGHFRATARLESDVAPPEQGATEVRVV